MNKLVHMGLALVVALTLAPVRGEAQSREAQCSTYARNQAEMATPAGVGAVGGATRGGAAGAVIGGVAGGWGGAGRGAAVGAGLGAIGGSARAGANRQANYRYYFDACMRGARY